MIHYLDDFFFAVPPASEECAEALKVALPLCGKLGLPVAPTKVEGPSTVMTFLGIEIGTVRQQIQLPQSKLSRLREMLHEWEGRTNPSKHQLQSLIGQLSHAATVVKPGCTFLRQFIETMKVPKRGSQRVRLNAHSRADLQWWSIFLADWNGVSFLFQQPLGTTMLSDASGSWGCGAFCLESLEWFQASWPPSWASHCIAAKELFPIVVGAAIWGRSWSGSTVLFKCDNIAVVQALSSMAA